VIPTLAELEATLLRRWLGFAASAIGGSGTGAALGASLTGLCGPAAGLFILAGCASGLLVSALVLLYWSVSLRLAYRRATKEV